MPCMSGTLLDHHFSSFFACSDDQERTTSWLTQPLEARMGGPYQHGAQTILIRNLGLQ
jgi:arabinogalactan endo-1,4-beta-galactosidase